MHIVTLAHTHIDLVPDLNAIGSRIKLFDPRPKCDLVLDLNVLMHTVTLAHTHIDSVPDPTGPGSNYDLIPDPNAIWSWTQWSRTLI